MTAEPQALSDRARPAVAAPARCWRCREPVLTDSVRKRERRSGATATFHTGCWSDIEREAVVARAERDAWLRGVVEARAAVALRGAPDFPWCRVGAPEFMQRVHARFAGVAERWKPARGNVALLGPTGTGKTSSVLALVSRLAADAAAACVAQQTHDTPEYALLAGLVWTTAAALVTARREHPLGQGEAPAFARAAAARLLVLDELGQEPGDPRWLLELLDLRYTRGRITLSTSGLTRAELESRYGSGAARRLVEPHGAFVDVHGGQGA